MVGGDDADYTPINFLNAILGTPPEEAGHTPAGQDITTDYQIIEDLGFEIEESYKHVF